jgi:hypothetical protein
MPLLDFIKNLAQREKYKSKVRSEDGKYITKTKEVRIPLTGGAEDATRIKTKVVKRPTLLGGANGKREVTKEDVTIQRGSEKNYEEYRKKQKERQEMEPKEGMSEMKESGNREMKSEIEKSSKKEESNPHTTDGGAMEKVKDHKTGQMVFKEGKELDEWYKEEKKKNKNK